MDLDVMSLERSRISPNVFGLEPLLDVPGDLIKSFLLLGALPSRILLSLPDCPLSIPLLLARAFSFAPLLS
jgi:hypothetical protein